MVIRETWVMLTQVFFHLCLHGLQLVNCSCHSKVKSWHCQSNSPRVCHWKSLAPTCVSGRMFWTECWVWQHAQTIEASVFFTVASSCSRGPSTGVLWHSRLSCFTQEPAVALHLSYIILPNTGDPYDSFDYLLLVSHFSCKNLQCYLHSSGCS